MFVSSYVLSSYVLCLRKSAHCENLYQRMNQRPVSCGSHKMFWMAPYYFPVTIYGKVMNHLCMLLTPPVRGAAQFVKASGRVRLVFWVSLYLCQSENQQTLCAVQPFKSNVLFIILRTGWGWTIQSTHADGNNWNDEFSRMLRSRQQ